MKNILEWTDGEQFDRILITGVRVLFTVAAIGCLPFIIWNIAAMLMNSL